MANHTNFYGLEARKFDTSDFQDESVKRIMKKLSDLERAALPEEQLKEVRKTLLTYLKAVLCLLCNEK